MKQLTVKIILCLAVAMSALGASAQVKEFEKISNREGITNLYVSKFMLNIVGKEVAPNVPGVNVKGLMSKLDGIQIIAAETKDAATDLRRFTLNYVKDKKCEVIMKMEEDGNQMECYYKEEKKQSVLVMLVSQAADEVCTMVFSGNFTQKDIMNLIKK